jgi:hypothetical protein
MQADEINQLGEKLDAWLDNLLPLLESNDAGAQGKALHDGIEILKELDRIKAEGLAALSGFLNRQDTISQGERIASLVQGFVFGVQLLAALYDVGDTDGGNEVAALVREIVRKLDGIEPSGAGLAVLLNHPNDVVRVYAGQYLIDRMPERVVPVLRPIEEKNEGRHADIRAMTVLFPWDWEQKEKYRSTEKS